MDDWDWQGEQQRDRDELQHAATVAALASLSRPLSEDEMMALAYSAGIANDVWKELHK